MATHTPNTNPIAALGDVTRIGELRKRLLFLLGALIVYRIGTFIPVPGVDPAQLARFFTEQQGTLLSMMNMLSGGAMRRLSIFALSVTPYITASIIVQMMAVVVPSLEAIKKEGESGRRKLTQYTRMGTVALSAFQAIGAAVALENQGVIIPGWQSTLIATVTLVAGTMFLMWLGEQITERGLGNGISMIILSGIVAGLPGALGGVLQSVSNGEMSPFIAIFLFIVVVGVTYFVVFVERGQRRIQVTYPKRQQGGRVMAPQTTHIPFKLNMSGVIPPIFASSLLLFPQTIASWFGSATGGGWLQEVAAAISPGQPIHMILYGSFIVFFCFFYTALVFNARETADNLRKSGAFIPGVRPGQQTGEYIDKVLTRLTVWGAMYVAGVCLLPEFLVSKFGISLNFGGTSLMIMVVVIMDFQAQVAAHVMSRQYESVMKRANLSGYGRPAGQ